jgi:isopenicillin-N epimerase
MKRNIKKEFLLDPDIHFFNHGSFGACPRPVFEVYQSFQRELEKKPVEFLDRQIIKRMEETRSILAEFINCQANEVVFFSNPTITINMVIRNLELEHGDEILSTEHEYGLFQQGTPAIRKWQRYPGSTLNPPLHIRQCQIKNCLVVIS